MKDQVKTLQQRGVRSVYVGDADEEAHEQIHNGEFQLLFISPKLSSPIPNGEICYSHLFTRRIW